ncbi:hypothetical protein IJ750_02575 [bacterium]|nr:hypothetical protein [bacterium]
MTLRFLDIYNDVAGQAWSMYDGDAESVDEMESALKSSINKALSELWCSYPFPFRIKTMSFTTREENNEYSTPNGNILRKTVSGKQVYSIRIGSNYLEYLDDFETLEQKSGKPTGFYVSNENIYLYPTPDDAYTVNVEYLTLAIGEDDFGTAVYSLVNDEDAIDIPEKYENIFKNALITKSMLYAIASETDENYSGYKEQYERAYKILLDYTSGLKKERKVFW